MESDDKEIENSEEDFEVLEDSIASDEPDEKLSGQLNYSNNLYDKNNINPISNKNDVSNLSSKIGKANSFLNGLNNIKEVNMDSDEEENRTSSLPKNDSLEESKNRNKGNLGNTINQRLKNIAKKQANKKINLIKTKILIKYVLPAAIVLVLAFLGFFTIAYFIKQISTPFSFLSSFFFKGDDDEEYTNEDGFANELYELIDEDIVGKDPKEMTTEEMMQYFLEHNPCDNRGVLTKFWDFIRPGASSICELYNEIRTKIKTKAENEKINVSYGLIIGTLINGYNYEREFVNTLDENGDTIYNANTDDESADVYGDSASSSQIIYDIYNGTGNIQLADLDTMLNNMIFHEEYTIYTYEVEEVDIVENGIISGVKYYHKCSGKKVKDTYLDYQKYLIFLRYGESRAEKYEDYYNLNKSWEHSDEQCKLSMDFTNKEETTTIPVLAGDPGFDENNLGQTRTWTIKEIYMQSYKQANESFKMCGDRMTDYIDISDLYETADFETNDLDVLTNSYGDGFMAQKFNNIQEGASDTTDKFFAKNLEKYIREIIEYAIEMDETLGIEADFMSSYFDSKGGLIPNYNCSDKKNSGTCPVWDNIRITSCYMEGPTLIDSENYIKRKNEYGIEIFPGGSTEWKKFEGRQIYKAKETIDFKEYVFGVTFAEIGIYINSGNIEAIKAFMIMLMSYALASEQESWGRVLQNSDGVYVPGEHNCFQVYYPSKHLGSDQISVLEEAYEEAKDYRLFTKNTDNIFMCEYRSDQQNLLVDLVESNPGITFKELLEHPDFIASWPTYQNYELKTCKGSSAEVGDFIYFNQTDYGHYKMGNTESSDLCGNSNYGSFADNGCGVTSMAIAAANLKNDSSITPDEIQKYMCSSTTHELIGFETAASNYGLSATPIARNEVTDYLDNGCMVIIEGAPGTFSNVQHYVVIAKYDGDNVFILDPYWTDNNGWSSKLEKRNDISVSEHEYTWSFFDEKLQINNYTAICG